MIINIVKAAEFDNKELNLIELAFNVAHHFDRYISRRVQNGRV